MTTRKRGGIRPKQLEQQRKIMMQGRYEEEKGEGKEGEDMECQPCGEEVLVKVVRDPGLPTE